MNSSNFGRMESSGGTDHDHGSIALLSEILSVLKRIDGHLELHEKRFNDLDTKIAKVVDARENRPLAAYTGNDLRLTQPDFTGRRRFGSLPVTSPSTTRRDLTVLTESQHDSFDSRHAPDSIRGFPASDNREQSTVRRVLFRGTPQKTDTAKIVFAESPRAHNNSPVTFSSVARSGTWSSLEPPPTGVQDEFDEEIIESRDLTLYAKFPPPKAWIATRTQGRPLDVKYGSQQAQGLWRQYVGDSWTIPPDGRVEMTFQQHILERLDKDQAVLLLEILRGVSSQLEYTGLSVSDPNRRGSLRVKDINFDPEYEESVADYRAEMPIGPLRKHRLKDGISRRSSVDPPQSAPWKRIIEIRGLSKKLIDENELWNNNFRDPFYEGLPVVSDICPFFTNRAPDIKYKTFTSMRTVHEALKHHQHCWRRPPPCDDGLCFHITFYELIDLSHEQELDGELWRSGRLHSDDESELQAFSGVKSRRMRESACTIVVVPDAAILQHWTMLYLCPNSFDQYDQNRSFERYDTFSNAVKDRDAAASLELMIEFSIRMVIDRWEKITQYFAWLIGHRDTLSDPNAHDSLLFDDDSFSRSRKYFWAINYLAELDTSISENIIQLERFTKTNTILGDQLSQLEYLRGRLRYQRNEAIALRDGLFSASGVMESRASTRLGENVKLLTFVSIFFLPLSFCMSVWSISDNIFSLRALSVVAVLVGCGTYFIVFNLDAMATFFRKAYSTRKMRLIEQMKSDPDSTWRERAKKFVVFQPKHENMKPSEWTIAAFIFHKIFRGFAVRIPTRTLKRARNQDAAPTHDISSWQDIELPTLNDLKAPIVGTSDVLKRSSIKDSIVRLSRTFTMRRGALSPTNV